MRIDGKTRIVAVLGNPIAHTASPAMHNAAFEFLGLNWRYIALNVEALRLKTVLEGLACGGLVGVNLTVPHKILAARMIHRADPGVRQLGAANTLRLSMVRGRPYFEGFNTDGHGLLQALAEEFGFRPRGKTVALIGCGGAGRGAAIQLALAGARRLILLNRTRSKSVEIARRIRRLRLPTTCAFDPEPCDLAVQATSLGLRPSDSLPVSVDLLDRLGPAIFFDMIYRPSPTPAMRLAHRRGWRAANGLGMLLHQGAKAFEIWTGRKAPVEVMRRALKREIYGK